MIFGKKRAENFTPIVKVSDETNTLTGKRRLYTFSEVEAGITQDKFSLSTLAFCGFSIIAQGGLIVINWKRLPPELPLFYSKPWGEEMLARPLFLLILPTTVFIFVIVNYWILLSTRENIFLRRIITTFTFLVAFLCIYSLTRLISLLV